MHKLKERLCSLSSIKYLGKYVFFNLFWTKILLNKNIQNACNMKNIQTIISIITTSFWYQKYNFWYNTNTYKGLKIYFFPLLYKLQLNFLSIFIAIYCASNYLFHVIRERKGKVSLFYNLTLNWFEIGWTCAAKIENTG